MDQKRFNWFRKMFSSDVKINGHKKCAKSQVNKYYDSEISDKNILALLRSQFQ